MDNPEHKQTSNQNIDLMRQELGTSKELEKKLQEINAIKEELRSAREREKKLLEALLEVFPVNLYKRVREVPEAYDDEQKIIDHFVNHGIKEIDFKNIITKNTNYLDLAIPKNQYHILEEAFRLISAELKEARKREAARVLQTSTGCLRDTGVVSRKESNHEGVERERIFVKTQGNPINLQVNQSHHFAMSHTSVHYKSNSVCTWIPKIACSSLRYSIAIANGAIENIEDMEWIHANNDCFNASTKEALEAKFTFVILRNPFKRLLSFFLDKLCHTSQSETDKSYQNAKEIFEFDPSMSFEDFINQIWLYPHKINDDEHTRPQCDFLLYKNYDRYYSMERLEVALEEIRTKTGLELFDTRDKNTIHTTHDLTIDRKITHQTKAAEIKQLSNEGRAPEAKYMYNKRMIAKVAAIYLQDIIMYANRVPDGISELDYWIEQSYQLEEL